MAEEKKKLVDKKGRILDGFTAIQKLVDAGIIPDGNITSVVLVFSGQDVARMYIDHHVLVHQVDRLIEVLTEDELEFIPDDEVDPDGG